MLSPIGLDVPLSRQGIPAVHALLFARNVFPLYRVHVYDTLNSDNTKDTSVSFKITLFPEL